ncbi:MAG: hypothetical protein IT480_12045 [Gammaproteobacteria bacterium]|nr:hypothetical protein [Gammaproteobacteria bacterium]
MRSIPDTEGIDARPAAGRDRTSTILMLFVLGAVLLAAAIPSRAQAAEAVDRALVGTWQLEWPRPALYWAVRADGVYRMHGPGAMPRQLGRLEAQGGRFSMNSAVWVDSGSYRVSGDELVITGKLGPGTWRRVWAPGGRAAAAASGPGACSLVSPADAAEVLRAPATGTPDARAGDNGCLFRSGLSNLDSLTIRIRRNQGQFFQNLRKNARTSAIDVPGVGDQAWAKDDGTGLIREMTFLRGDTWVTISASLQPELAREDIPALVTLARAVDRRLSGFSLPAR